MVEGAEESMYSTLESCEVRREYLFYFGISNPEDLLLRNQNGISNLMCAMQTLASSRGLTCRIPSRLSKDCF